jgi:hypothetical protein
MGEREALASSHKSVDVEGFDEGTARISAKRIIHNTARIETIRLKREGRKGFLGIGKKPHVYQVEVFQPVVAEVSFKAKAKIRVEIGEIPSSGYCQMCGRGNSTAHKSGESVHYFCSSSCSERYFKAALGATLFGPGTAFINMSGQDLSGTITAGRAMAASATAHCWSCGATIPMTKDTCGACGKEQEIKL